MGQHDGNVDRTVAAYTELEPSLHPVTDHAISLLTSLIDDAGINYLAVSGRTKSPASFAAKARRYEGDASVDPLKVITDQVGTRIITYVRSDVLAVADLLSEHFTVLDDRDMGQETAREGRFGYSSRHLVVSIDPVGPDGELPEYDPLRCISVQLRTVLQHAWAEFEHDVRYKGTIPPEQVPDLDRRFTLAAGLLELADNEFTSIRDRLQAGLSGGTITVDVADPRISPPELATFLAGRYSSAGWSRTEHYEWIATLLLELGIDSLDALSALLGDVDSSTVTNAMGYKYPPGAVRRLDDDLLVSLGDRYVELPGNERRREPLRVRLAKGSNHDKQEEKDRD
ncbi:MAG: GTP pyrophosphokinase [Ornithinimicrobium sp.]|uniref:GTP pyrophosphokinase n=1 Tax=Ornithinimicrobium sp. TaxID=1977084 RepID=UPI0026E06E65|nr:GTP pyrophosphokinase [Ornithinimicrobium sp.]MDO5740307.1 GTP pyrophosphokinase [Ornithinimicrobium sp.]